MCTLIFNQNGIYIAVHNGITNASTNTTTSICTTSIDNTTRLLQQKSLQMQEPMPTPTTTPKSQQIILLNNLPPPPPSSQARTGCHLLEVIHERRILLQLSPVGAHVLQQLKPVLWRHRPKLGQDESSDNSRVRHPLHPNVTNEVGQLW